MYQTRRTYVRQYTLPYKPKSECWKLQACVVLMKDGQQCTYNMQLVLQQAPSKVSTYTAVVTALQAAHSKFYSDAGKSAQDYMAADVYAADSFADCIRPITADVFASLWPRTRSGGCVEVIVISPGDLGLLQGQTLTRGAQLAGRNPAAAEKMAVPVKLIVLRPGEFHPEKDNCGHMYCIMLQQKWRHHNASAQATPAPVEAEEVPLVDEDCNESFAPTESENLDDEECDKDEADDDIAAAMEAMRGMWRHVKDCVCSDCAKDRLLDRANDPFVITGRHVTGAFGEYMRTMLCNEQLQKQLVAHLQTGGRDTLVKISTATMCLKLCLDMKVTTDVISRQAYVDDCARRQNSAAAGLSVFVGTAVMNPAMRTIAFSHNAAKNTANIVMFAVDKTFMCKCPICFVVVATEGSGCGEDDVM